MNSQPIKHTLGTGAGANRYYCGRVLGSEAIPGSDGQCGPDNGPQCEACKTYQARYPPKFYAGCAVRIKAVDVEIAKELSKDFGGWVAKMQPMLGCGGYITLVDANGGLRIAIDGTSCVWNPELVEFIAAPPYALGAMVFVQRISVKEVKQLFAGKKLAWSDDIEGLLGRFGVVTAFGGEGIVRVKVNTTNSNVPTALLEPATSVLFPGATLRIRNVKLDEAKALQTGHGGFADHMEAMIGNIGLVISIDEDGDLRMSVNNSMACFNPNLVEPPNLVQSFRIDDPVRIRNMRIDEAIILASLAGVTITDQVRLLSDNLGKVGQVKALDEANKKVVIQLKEGGSNADMSVPPIFLELVLNKTLTVGTQVRIRNVSVKEAAKLQEGHGGWDDRLSHLLGKVGEVEENY